MRSFILLLAAALVLTACGPRWYYDHLDWMIPWYVDDYLTLDTRQRSALEKRLADQLDWHCRTQLPEYAAFLRSVAQDFDDPHRVVPRERFAHHLETLRYHWRNLMAGIGPDMADLLIAVSDAQIDELFENLEKDNQELERKYVDPPFDERIEKRIDRMIARLERWIGNLDDSQREAVAGWARQIGPTSDQWIAQRRRTQGAFREVLGRRTTDPMYKAHFIALLVSPEKLRTAVYQSRLDRNTGYTLDLLTEVGRTMSDTQRAEFIRELASLAEDFEILACEEPDRTQISYP